MSWSTENSQTNTVEVPQANIEVKLRPLVRPLGDRILVEVIPVDEQTINGIFIPEVAQERPQQGKVILVGKGKWVNGERIPVDVSEGDVVQYSKYSGNELTRNGIKYLILQENELLGVEQEV